jgi:hypothetical protein
MINSKLSSQILKINYWKIFSFSSVIITIGSSFVGASYGLYSGFSTEVAKNQSILTKVVTIPFNSLFMGGIGLILSGIVGVALSLWLYVILLITQAIKRSTLALIIANLDESNKSHHIIANDLLDTTDHEAFTKNELDALYEFIKT